MPISEGRLQDAYARYFFCLFDASLRQDECDYQAARAGLEDFLAADEAPALFQASATGGRALHA